MKIVYIFTFFGLFLICLLGAMSYSHAACSSPDGAAGEMGFDLTGSGQMEYCDDTNWIAAGLPASVVDPESSVNANLILHWRLDDTSGSSISDSIGSFIGTWSDNDDSDVSGETLSGIVSSALQFDGADDYITIADNAQLSGSSGVDFTWSFWFNPDSVPGVEYYLLTKSQSAGFKDYEFMYRADQTVSFYYENGGSNDGPCLCATTSTFNTGEWNHIAASFDGGSRELKIYVNGVFENSYSLTYDLPDGTGSLQLGQRAYTAGTYNFDGAMDDVRIYDRVLTDTEVAYLYSSTKNLIAYWKMDETSGTSTEDSSGYDHTGTLSGGLDAGSDSIIGKLEKSFLFNGTSDYIDAGSGASLDNIFLSPGSIAAWVYPIGLGQNMQGRIVNKAADSARTDGWALMFDTSPGSELQYTVEYGTQRLNRSTDLMAFEEWTHVVVTWDGSTTASNVHIYYDGVEVSSYTQTIDGSGTLPDDSSYTFRIGGFDSSFRGWDGRLDDVRVFARELSSTDISTLYQQTQKYGLIGHWRLDETSGTNVTDYSSGGNDGTFNGEVAVVSAAGKVGAALTFDGSDDEIEITGLLGEPRNITLSAWVNLAAVDSGGSEIISLGDRVFIRADDDPSGHVIGVFNNGSWQILNSGLSIEGTGFRHIAYTLDTSSNEQFLYVDGVVVDTGNATGDIAYNTGADTYIGAHGGGALTAFDFDGAIDDVRVYNRALSAFEIAKLSICTKPGEMGYSWAAHVLQWCSNKLDAYDAGAAGAGGGGCAASGTKDAGVEGTYQYDTTSNKMVFCDGVNWVNMPN